MLQVFSVPSQTVASQFLEICQVICQPQAGIMLQCICKARVPVNGSTVAGQRKHAGYTD